MAVANFSLFTFRFSLITLLFSLLSCGPDEGVFLMEGSFKGFSQGEFYVYSPDGALRKIDTIAVRNGEFRYRIRLDEPHTLVLLFPNYSELPIIAEPTSEVQVEGDASHLKETSVKGTRENEQLTKFRLQTAELSPPEVTKQVVQFIQKNPQSQASRYLFNRYFVSVPKADYQQALTLTDSMLRVQPDDSSLKLLKKQLSGLIDKHEGGRLAKFTDTDINGKSVSNADLGARVNVVTVWATWNYESQNIQRQLRALKKQHDSDLRIVSICLDASVQDCRRQLERDSIMWSNVCDGRMWENTTLRKLGFYNIPDNIITDAQGRIVAHSLDASHLRERIEKLLE